ncbi:MAG: sigma-70 family RNA polymerase sigma factor [Brevibacillus sp.]|nr:sigma-70 family RNA polymerase sigma factor [Brevibacillus sp.]
MTPALQYLQIYRDYSGKIYSYFRMRVANDWDAEDLTSIVFLKAFANLSQYDDRHPLGAWIYRIAHNTLVDFLRKRREKPIDTDEFDKTETDCTLQPEQALQRAVSRREPAGLFPEDHRCPLAHGG